jgi:hypothetical protein
MGSSAQGVAYTIDQSCRFNDNDSAYLSRTPRVAGNRRTWTWSGWIKIASNLANTRYIMGAADDANNRTWMSFYGTTAGDIEIRNRVASSNTTNIKTSRLFRDPSAWYHIVLAFDTTQATASNRVKLYVNGVQETAFSSATYPSQNEETFVNKAGTPQSIGSRPEDLGGSNDYDGYMADVHLIDGQQLAASAFGESDDNGNWVPIAYAGTTTITSYDHSLLGKAQSTTITTGYNVPGNRCGLKWRNVSAATLIGAVCDVTAVTTSFDATCEIWTAGGDDTPGTQLGGNSDATTLGTTGEKLFTWSSNAPVLEADTDYWMIIENPQSGTGQVNVSVCADQGSAYSSGRSDGDENINDGEYSITGDLRFRIQTGYTDTANAYGTNGFHLDFADSSHFGRDVSVAGPYEPVAVVFDGTNDGLARGADLTGSADGKLATGSFWFKLDSSSVNDDNIIYSGASGAQPSITKRSSGDGNDILFALQSSQQTFDTGSNTYGDTDWHHVLWSVDAGNAKQHLWVDGIDVVSHVTNNDVTLDWARANHGIGDDPSSSSASRLFGEMAEFWMALEYVDLSVAANRLKFTTASGMPKDLGSDGSGPTDTAAIMYFKNPLATWHTNVGSGGGFTENGALTAGDNSGLIGNSFNDSGLATNDQVTDSPSDDADNDVGNYCTISPINTLSGIPLSDGNLVATFSSAGVLWLTTELHSGKWFFMSQSSATDNNAKMGPTNADHAKGTWTGAGSQGSGTTNGWAGAWTSTTQLTLEYNDTQSPQATITTIDTSNDWMVHAIDVDGLKYWLGHYDASDDEIEWMDSSGTLRTTDEPGLGRNQTATISGSLPFSLGGYLGSGTQKIDCGQLGGQGIAIPSGFKYMNTANLPAPTITDPSKYFQVNLRSGTSSEAAITLTDAAGGAVKPDFVWIKERDDTVQHVLTDSVRGATKEFNSDSTAAESSVAEGLKSFDTSGYTIGTDDNYNDTGDTYVDWIWRTQGGAGSSNTEGSTNTTTTSVGVTQGFSMSTYPGTNDVSNTLGHGLSSAPEFMIAKRVSGDTWHVYHQGVDASDPEDYEMHLNATTARTDTTVIWNDTAPTSSLITIGTDGGINASGQNYLMLAWHGVEGYSKFGSYTGNGNADGPFVWCGFSPRWIMTKRTSGTGQWSIVDTSRDPDNNNTNLNLFADSTEADQGGSPTGGRYYDILSNGFKLLATHPDINVSGTYIFAAFAEFPFGGDGVSQARAR